MCVFGVVCYCTHSFFFFSISFLISCGTFSCAVCVFAAFLHALFSIDDDIFGSALSLYLYINGNLCRMCCVSFECVYSSFWAQWIYWIHTARANLFYPLLLPILCASICRFSFRWVLIFGFAKKKKLLQYNVHIELLLPWISPSNDDSRKWKKCKQSSIFRNNGVWWWLMALFFLCSAFLVCCSYAKLALPLIVSCPFCTLPTNVQKGKIIIILFLLISSVPSYYHPKLHFFQLLLFYLLFLGCFLLSSFADVVLCRWMRERAFPVRARFCDLVAFCAFCNHKAWESKLKRLYSVLRR